MKEGMRRIFSIILILAPLTMFGQDDRMQKVLDKTCDCLKEIIDSTNTKPEFDKAFAQCNEDLAYRAYEIDTTYKHSKNLNKLIYTQLKESCAHFNTIVEIFNNYLNAEAAALILDSADCPIFKSGIYMGIGDKDSTQIHMMDTLQIVKFKDGTYTKSKVEWLDDCSYKMTRIESTNEFESQTVQPGDVRKVRIIGVHDKKTFTYEIDVHGKLYQGKIEKID